MWRIILRRLPTFLWEFFFTLTWLNLWANLIRIIWSDNLLMLSKAISTRLGAPWTHYNFRVCSAGYLTQKNSQEWREGAFLIFILQPFFPLAFFPSAIFSSAFFPVIFSAAILSRYRAVLYYFFKFWLIKFY